MKYLIFTDLHGALEPMQKLEKIYLEENCQGIICLGDILYHGPRNDLPSTYAPKKVIEILKKYVDKMIWVQGNCDAEVDEMVLGINFSKRKEIDMFNHTFILTHGHHLSRFEVDQSIKEGSIVLYGHYHVFDISNISGVTYINVGSPSIPKDGIAQYALMDEKGIHIYRLDDNTILGEYLYE